MRMGGNVGSIVSPIMDSGMNKRKFFSLAIDNLRYVGMLGGVLVMLSFLSCATQRGSGTTTTIIEKDSSDVRVEIRTEYITDTLIIEIPAQTAERTTQDSISHLENDYAESDARINPDGSLFHSLNTKPQKKPMEYQKPIEHKDSVRIEYKYKDKEVKVPVEVEKKLSWWQSTSIRFFPYSIILIIGMAGWIFRSPIGKLWKFIKVLV